MGCHRFREFMAEQRLLLERHYERHAWFKGIKDHEIAKAEFLLEFGGIIRETYCEACPVHSDCSDYRNYLKMVLHT
jgi:hypothetical protein